MSEHVYNPFSGEDEVIYKDKDGSFKVLKGSEMATASPPAPAQSPKQPIAAPSPYETIVIKEMAPPAQVDYDAEAHRLAERMRLPYEDEVLGRRLITIIVTALRGIRDQVEIQEILTRATKVGGMGYAPGLAEKYAAALERAHRGLMDGTKQVSPELLDALGEIGKAAVPVQSGSQPTVPSPEKKDILKLIDEMPEYDILPKPEKKLPPREPRPRFQAQVRPGPMTPAPITASPRPPAPVQPMPAAAEPEPTAAGPAAPAAEAEPVRFFHRRPNVVGPVDELREMDVTEFRRLSPNPHEACQKVKEKFLFLEQDSFAKKAEGIKAWRQSKVYQLYVETGKETMLSKSTVDKVAASRKSENKPFLSQPEFEAIMDLNEQIRF